MIEINKTNVLSSLLMVRHISAEQRKILLDHVEQNETMVVNKAKNRFIEYGAHPSCRNAYRKIDLPFLSRTLTQITDKFKENPEEPEEKDNFIAGVTALSALMEQWAQEG